MDTPDDGTEPIGLAAEYALSVLTGDEFREAHERVRADGEFRAEVARWTARFSPLLEEASEVPPPASAWSAIQRRIGTQASNDNVHFLSRQVARWRGIAAGMTAIAASLLVVLLWPLPGFKSDAPLVRQTVPAPAPMVAMLGNDAQGTEVVASWDPAARQLVLVVAGDLKGDDSHSRELWVIPKGSKPSSLGTMPVTKQMHMRLADTLARLLENGATLAISVEPRGGSPTGLPTGPVVASGSLTQA